MSLLVYMSKNEDDIIYYSNACITSKVCELSPSFKKLIDYATFKSQSFKLQPIEYMPWINMFKRELFELQSKHDKNKISIDQDIKGLKDILNSMYDGLKRGLRDNKPILIG